MSLGFIFWFSRGKEGSSGEVSPELTECKGGWGADLTTFSHLIGENSASDINSLVPTTYQ